MSAITQKIDALLKQEGYSRLEAGRFGGMKLNNHTNVNRMEYMRGERDRVFIYTHETEETMKKEYKK